MNEMFSQGGKGSTGILTNKQAIARHFGVKQSEIVYFSVGVVISGYRVIYDKVTQRAYSLPIGIPTGTTAISLSAAAVLVHSQGSVDLGALAVTREEYVTLPGSFTSGATLTVKNELLVYLDSKYRWGGAFPKTIPANSTPVSTGGVGLGAWLSVGDASFRSELAKNDGLKHIGSCESIAELRTISGETNGQKIFLNSVLPGRNIGGGIFQWDAASTFIDEGGCIIKPNSMEVGRWVRQNVVEKTPEMFGALGDGVTDDTDAITAMFYSDQINKHDFDKFYGCFRLSRKYLISREIDTYWAIRVDARGAHFIINSSITAFTPTCMANGEWQGGYFDYSGVPNSELNENAVALWPMKNVSSATAGYLTVMHTLITGIKTQGCHTAIKMTPETGYTWQTHIELCELGVRAGVSEEKAHAINIEATGTTNGGSTTLSMSKISTQDFTHSPRGVGRAGYRIWNISGVRMYDCSFDNETVGSRDVVDIFANFVEITGFHTENIVNTTAASNDGPFRIIGDIVVLDNFIMLDTDVWEPSCWISVYRGGVGSKVNIGQWYQKKKGNQHQEWVLDLNKDQYSDVNLLGNVTPDQVFGMRTRGNMLSASASNYNVYHIEKSIQSGTAFITLPDTRSAYEISFRGDCVSDTGIAFYGTVKAVRSYSQGPYSVKYDVVNTENTFPSSTYPVSITAVGNQLVFTVPTGLAFDVQSKIDKKLTISELY